MGLVLHYISDKLISLLTPVMSSSYGISYTIVYIICI